ncbi:MAG: isoprenylcysteine carboxylmethyltransferase family protein [bacterium]
MKFYYKSDWQVKLGHFLFRIRSYTPLPFIVCALLFAKPGLFTWIAGLCLVIIGEWIRIWGVAFAGGSTRTRKVLCSNLITTGPFGYVRNPLYLGNLILSCGLLLVSFALFPELLGLYLIFFIFQYYFIVLFEESYLNQGIGQAYIEYCISVNRFLPRFKPFNIKSSQKPDYKSAIVSEKDTLTAIGLLLIILVALTLIKSI